jgi:hypothetical protein
LIFAVLEVLLKIEWKWGTGSMHPAC